MYLMIRPYGAASLTTASLPRAAWASRTGCDVQMPDAQLES
jgi:hypothetical protein